jgi:hypothetical protein
MIKYEVHNHTGVHTFTKEELEAIDKFVFAIAEDFEVGEKFEHENDDGVPFSIERIK